MKLSEIINEAVVPFPERTRSTHKFRVGQKVGHAEVQGWHGRIVALITLGDAVDGDCDPEECEQPWYQIKWVGRSFAHGAPHLPEDVGQEPEAVLVPED